jgi:hypothetical protein
MKRRSIGHTFCYFSNENMIVNKSSFKRQTCCSRILSNDFETLSYYNDFSWTSSLAHWRAQERYVIKRDQKRAHESVSSIVLVVEEIIILINSLTIRPQRPTIPTCIILI